MIVNISAAAYVNPHVAILLDLKKELVIDAVLHNDVELLDGILGIFYTDVSCLASHVLGVGRPSYCLIDLRAAVATADENWLALCITHRLKHVFAKSCQIQDLLLIWLVLDAEPFGCGGVSELLEGKIR